MIVNERVYIIVLQHVNFFQLATSHDEKIYCT